jgi:hypothetical protein
MTRHMDANSVLKAEADGGDTDIQSTVVCVDRQADCCELSRSSRQGSLFDGLRQWLWDQQCLKKVLPASAVSIVSTFHIVANSTAFDLSFQVWERAFRNGL